MPNVESNVRLESITLTLRPEQKSRVNQLSHPGAPFLSFLTFKLSHLWLMELPTSWLLNSFLMTPVVTLHNFLVFWIQQNVPDSSRTFFALDLPFPKATLSYFIMKWPLETTVWMLEVVRMTRLFTVSWH